jgi:hypothetical protein
MTKPFHSQYTSSMGCYNNNYGNTVTVTETSTETSTYTQTYTQTVHTYMSYLRFRADIVRL